MTATDTELWDRAAAGDVDAFGALFSRHAPAVHAYCLRRTADPAAADDLTSIVFLETWRRRANVQIEPGALRAWLLGVAVNSLRGHWRSRRRHAAALARLRVETAAPDEIDRAAERLDAAARLREASDALAGLRREERDVLTLIAWGELDYEGVALALGIPVGTVRSRLARARRRLREHPSLVSEEART
ncbi:MAG TPA: sigma-70 family RNA polymerase sigma factor [Solirubrobacteraceae bacterium]|nr:sigma-70 family RNA polymerase sigma factor [Solirubrobacteraceae bacterium]